MMLVSRSEKFHEGGFRRFQSNSYFERSQLEIMEQLCDEIKLLARDSKNFEQQYVTVLKYYQNLVS